MSDINFYILDDSIGKMLILCTKNYTIVLTLQRKLQMLQKTSISFQMVPTALYIFNNLRSHHFLSCPLARWNI